MPHLNLESQTHSHRFQTVSPVGKSRTMAVLALTVVVMAIEIITGLFFNSMALFADGCHMATHVIALGIAVFAYIYAERHKDDPRFSFGPGKVGALAGFSSATLLGLVAAYMVYESVARLLHPLPISFNEAIGVAVLGLVVNLLSAWLLRDQPELHGHSHGGHGHSHPHDESTHGAASHHHHHSHGHDLNLRSAYLHVLADAATSLLAIFALSCGKFFGWIWLDPTMGIVGAIVIAQWTFSLLRQTSTILLDREMDPAAVEEIRAALEADGETRLTDLHLLRVGLNQFAVIVSVMAEKPREPEFYKNLLRQHEELAHISVEINFSQPFPERVEGSWT